MERKIYLVMWITRLTLEPNVSSRIYTSFETYLFSSFKKACNFIQDHKESVIKRGFEINKSIPDMLVFTQMETNGDLYRHELSVVTKTVQ